MFTDHNYNPHVIMEREEMKLPGGNTVDKLLALFLTVCGLIGTSGNFMAIKYFLSTRRRDLAAVLYLLSCICDFLLGLVQYPVVVALFLSRAPGMFNNLTFCSTWNVFFFLLQKVAIFVVMILSVSRTVAIVLPFYQVKRVPVLAAVLLYSVALIINDVIGATTMAKFYYLSVGSFCVLQPTTDEAKGGVTIMLALTVAIPSFITFLSFIVSVLHLTRLKAVASTQSNSKEASFTIAIFTGCFILCNLPYCLILVLENIRITANIPYPGPFLENEIVFWYAWPISSVVFIVLNSAINPILYYRRMAGFSKWCRKRTIFCTTTGKQKSGGTKKVPTIKLPHRDEAEFSSIDTVNVQPLAVQIPKH
ncbi:hypothetical protein ACHWQZ_G018011 [Mnemiopsis leidyi]